MSACNIQYANDNKTIKSVQSFNGKESTLFKEILNHVNENKDIAKEIYLYHYSDEFLTKYGDFTKIKEGEYKFKIDNSSKEP